MPEPSDRPYREAWYKKKALKHFHDQAGLSFDPRTVERFMRVMNENQTRDNGGKVLTTYYFFGGAYEGQDDGMTPSTSPT